MQAAIGVLALLIGTLQDGSSINVALAFGPSWSGTFNLVTVATPTKPTC